MKVFTLIYDVIYIAFMLFTIFVKKKYVMSYADYYPGWMVAQDVIYGICLSVMALVLTITYLM